MRLATGVRPLRLRVLVRALVLLCALLPRASEGSPPIAFLDALTNPVGPNTKCAGDQEYVGLEHYITLNVWEAIAEAAEHGSCCWRWACMLCEAGKYGVNGQCYACPQFTQHLLTPRAAGPRWCQNDCGQLYADSQSSILKILARGTGFPGITSKNEASNAVFHLNEKDEPVCRKCAPGRGVLKSSPSVILEYYVTDLLAMGFTGSAVQDMQRQHKEGLLQAFEWKICVKCLNGMIAFSKLEIPEDVQDMTTAAFEDQAAIDLATIEMPCKACSVASGVSSDGVNCRKCSSEQYQLGAKVYLPTPTLTGIVVGVECKHCKIGHQRYNPSSESLISTVRSGQCRSLYDDGCCTACPQNYFRSDLAMKTCKAVDSTQAGTKCMQLDGAGRCSELRLAASGATGERPCGPGEQLTFCTETGCTSASRAAQQAWRTCIPCAWNQTTKERADGPGCDACTKQEHIRSPADPRTCYSCTLCEEVVETDTEVDLSTAQGLHDVDPQKFKVRKVAAECKPLSRRRLTWSADLSTFSVEGEDHYRPPDRRKGQRIQDFQAVDRLDHCKAKHCAEFCSSLGFHYSDGCGPQTSPARVWLQSPADMKLQLGSLGSAAGSVDVAAWRVLTEGVCRECTPCAAGQYNDECNSQAAYTLGKPEGACKACTTQCPVGFFMRHPEKDAGCHDPPQHQMTTNGMWRIRANYACEQCPTWVKQGDSLLAVTACGLQTEYSYFSGAMNENDQLTPHVVAVQFTPADEQKFAVAGSNSPPRKNFRAFLKDAKNYCPPGFFFNSKQSGCGFVEDGAAFQLPGLGPEVSVGYDPYNPTCCVACKTCKAPLERKDMANWRECRGDSVQDVQNFCMEKCVLGYWSQRIANEIQCRQCSTCHDGIL